MITSFSLIFFFSRKKNNFFPVRKFRFKVSKKFHGRKSSIFLFSIYSLKSAMEATVKWHWSCSGIFIVNFEQIWHIAPVKSSHRGYSVKKVFLEISQNSQENTCARVSFLTKLQAACNLSKIETLAQVFSCEYYEIYKNTFFTEHFLATASVWSFHCWILNK